MMKNMRVSIKDIQIVNFKLDWRIRRCLSPVFRLSCNDLAIIERRRSCFQYHLLMVPSSFIFPDIT